jgi:hypothetical protein
MNTPALRRDPRPIQAFRPLAAPARTSVRPLPLPGPERLATPPRRPRLALPTPATRRGPAREVVAALLLLVAWALLWSFFVTAVAGPGARLAALAATHPSVAPAPVAAAAEAGGAAGAGPAGVRR